MLPINVWFRHAHRVALALALLGCTGTAETLTGDPGVDAGPGGPGYDSGLLSGCVTNERFFAREVWASTVESQCAGCHSATGLAAASELVFQNVSGRPDALEANYDALANVASLVAEGDERPLLLRKPLGELTHGGGAVLDSASLHYQRLQAFVERLGDPVVCDEEDVDFFDGVELESDYETLRRFALLFAARLPTDEEIARVDAGGEDVLGEIIDEMMDEEAFADRMAEGFNDVFLTVGADFKIAGLGTVNHPDLLWFFEFTGDERSDRLGKTVHGVWSAVPQLIKNIVMENEPFTQVLLADYTMVNPYSARSLSVFESIAWDDPNDADEFHPTQIRFGPDQQPFPHAGILNNYIYLTRYPSTETNVNRGRARAFLQQFLGTDILQFAPLMSDPLAIAAEYENPVRDAPDCAVCHSVVDPIAGIFHNHYNIAARYSGFVPEDTFPAGFELSSPDGGDVPFGERNWTGGLLPADRDFDSIRWLAERTVADPRFAPTMTRHFFSLVIGRPILKPPTGPASIERDGAFRAFEVQQEALTEFQQILEDSNYDTKAVVKAIVLSSFFRARSQTESSPALDAMRFDLGSAQLLTPEQLHRKIVAIFGDSFQTYPSYTDALMDYSKYRILYGGIDSTEVTDRLRDPNGIMAGVQQVLANNVSCKQAAREFGRPPAERLLLGGVELSTASASDEAAVRATLVHLSERLLGERLSADDPEIDRSYALFVQVQQQGAVEVAERRSRSGLGRTCSDGDITEDPDFVVRAWAAVLNYHIQTFEFLYQ